MKEWAMLFSLFLCLPSCKSTEDATPDEAAGKIVETDFGDLFGVREYELVVPQGSDLVSFEHLIRGEWKNMHTNEVSLAIDGVTMSLPWMVGLDPEHHLIYALPGFRGGYWLENSIGVLCFQKPSMEGDVMNLFFAEQDEKIVPCVRIRFTSK
ncbi:hypothetical protein [Roseibacillus persicicus]|uniref:hypothetical protein n=1 Tax=Roseibacillus persicicus TaxID=454148 RepID=UPI00280E75A5|nr:hypothetical protein [Roseibacillus persicicus]MDQ8192726.1 hypothetical protein [Roseibacillus persicicus]